MTLCFWGLPSRKWILKISQLSLVTNFFVFSLWMAHVIKFLLGEFWITLCACVCLACGRLT